MKSRMLLSIVSALAVLMFAAVAQAKTISIPPLPDFPTPAWTAGSSVTYSVKLDQGEDSIRFNFRIAVLGTERETATNKTLYWVEMDLTQISGIPADEQDFFMQNYGELPTAIRTNMLIPQYDLSLFLTDPSKVYSDFTGQGFLRKLYFQYNRQTPFDVDIPLVTAFIMPIMAGMMLDGDLPEDFNQSRNLGIRMMESPEEFDTENSTSQTTTGAGAFPGRLFAFTSRGDGASGSTFYTDQTPILPLVTYSGNWVRNEKPGTIELELTSIETSGTATQIVGTPVPFNFQTMMTYPNG